MEPAHKNNAHIYMYMYNAHMYNAHKVIQKVIQNK